MTDPHSMARPTGRAGGADAPEPQASRPVGAHPSRSDFRLFCIAFVASCITITLLDWFWPNMPKRTVADIAASRFYLAFAVAAFVVAFARRPNK